MGRRAVDHAALALFYVVATALLEMGLSAVVGASWSPAEILYGSAGAVLLTACGVGFLLQSRLASLAAAVFVGVGSMLVALEPSPSPWAVAELVIVSLFVWRGAWVCWAESQDRGRAMPWGAIPVAILVAVRMAYGGATELQLVPPSDVVPGERLADSHVEDLRRAGVLGPDEHVDWFYSDGSLSVLEDGSVLTDVRVISYERLEDDPFIVWAPFSRVERVERVQQGGWFKDTQIDVVLESGDSFMLLLSPEGGGDERFIEALRNRIRAARAAL